MLKSLKKTIDMCGESSGYWRGCGFHVAATRSSVLTQYLGCFLESTENYSLKE